MSRFNIHQLLNLVHTLQFYCSGIQDLSSLIKSLLVLIFYKKSSLEVLHFFPFFYTHIQ